MHTAKPITASNFDVDELTTAVLMFGVENLPAGLDVKTVVSYLINNVTPTLSEEHYPVRESFIVKSELEGIDPCFQAIVKVFVDVLSVLGSMFNLSLNWEKVTNKLILKLAGNNLDKFRHFIDYIKTGSAYEKAKAAWGIISGLNNLVGFNFFKVLLLEDLSTWDYVRFGVALVAQLLAWFASDGIAFIAQVALFIMSFVDLVKDSIIVAETCGPIPPPNRPPKERGMVKLASVGLGE